MPHPETPTPALEAAKQAEFELEIAPPQSAQLAANADASEPSASAAGTASAAADEEVIGEEESEPAVVAAVSTVAAKPTIVASLVPSPNATAVVNQNDPNPINRYCTCAAASCKCCRDFSLPIVPLRGPGCATLKYLEEDKMLVTVKYGDIVLTSRTISGRRAQPICIPLPGGYSRFCGRVYGISRKEENFKACLGLELRAEDEVEAALRVSCFQFGPKGLVTTPAEPLPPVVKDEDDDDDDDDDFLGLGGKCLSETKVICQTNYFECRLNTFY